VVGVRSAKASIFTSSYIETHTKSSPATKEEAGEPETEHQARYFVNEEKVIRNHLKLNVAL
jgi:hypothetical protein